MTQPKDPICRKPRKPPATVTNRMIERMKELRLANVDIKDIAAQLNVSPGVVTRRTKGLASPGENRSWKSVKKRRLDYDQIFYDLTCKVSRADICEEHGISRGYLKNIIRRHGKTMAPTALLRLKADVVAAYEDGDSIANIVAWSGRGHSVIRAWVGLMPTGKGGNAGKGLPTHEIADLYTRKDSPLDTVELAARYGCSPPAVCYHLRKAGIPVSPSRIRSNAKNKDAHYEQIAA